MKKHQRKLKNEAFCKSLIIHKKLISINNNYKTSFHFELPSEANIKLFKSRKKRFRILYGVVPMGEPTSFSFGRSIEFKLFGNISKTPSHKGISLGFGNHRVYN